MNDLKTNPWILAARPKTILASIGPVLIGLSIAFHLSQKINTTIALLTLICAILLQIGTNIANDYLDFKKGVDTLERLGPVRVTSKGLISEDKMKKALILILSSAFLCGIYLMIHGGPFIVAIGLLSLYFSYGYTGGPFPLSYNGLGELAALLFFWAYCSRWYNLFANTSI
jgi:1,4-dihydroxy-2-naphthoate octaprenyltransferase